MLGELEHRVLDDVQCRGVLANREDCLLVRPLLDFLEEIGQLFIGSQCACPVKKTDGSACRPPVGCERCESARASP
jgi:hypothetical protein